MKKLLLLVLFCSLYAPISAMFPDCSQFYEGVNTKPNQTILARTAQSCRNWAASVINQAQHIQWTKSHIAQAGLIAAVAAGAIYGVHTIFLPTNNSLLKNAQRELDKAKIYSSLYAKLQTHVKESFKNVTDPLKLDESTLESIASAYEYNVAENIEKTIKTLKYYNEFLKTRMNFAKTLATLHIKTDNNTSNQMLELQNQLEFFITNLEFIQVFTSGYKEYFELYTKIQDIKEIYGDGSPLEIPAPAFSDEYPCVRLISELDKDLKTLKNFMDKTYSHYPMLSQNATQLIDKLTEQKNIILESDTYKQELYNQKQHDWHIIKQQLAHTAEALGKYQSNDELEIPFRLEDNKLCVPGL
jgi:hypothetical protein